MTSSNGTTGSTLTRVTVLGTGAMGSGMARNLASGHDVTVWNRSRDKAESLSDVATVADSAAAAVAGAQVVVTMLFDADAVIEVLRAAGDGWAEDAVLVQTSTVGVEGADRIAEVAAELGLAYVDAPVLGTKQPAADGKLTVLASGDPDLLDRVAPVLEAVSAKVVHAGAAGAGSRLKLACNAWLVTVVQGVAESLAIAGALDVDPGLFLEAMAGSAVDAPYLQLKGKAMLAGDFAPSFALVGGLKDVELITAALADTDYDPRILPPLREHWRAAVEAGHADDDLASVYDAL